MKSLLLRLVVGLVVLLLLGLAIFSQTGLGGYFLSGLAGNVAILSSRESIQDVLADPELDDDTRKKLLLVEEIRDYAFSSLSLPKSQSYTSLAFIDRPYPGWSVYAAPQLSTTPHRWCFPVIGCIVYRGYFSREEAEAFAAELTEEQSLDTHIVPFIGYSFLGYIPDPVLSSQLRLPPERLASLVLHELAHQRLYFPNKTKINEAFARVVEREGLKRWLQEKGKFAELEAMQQSWQKSEERSQRVIATRERLAALYASDLSKEDKLAQKSELLLELQQYLCGDKCKTPMNNASLIPYTTYGEEIATIRELFKRAGEDFEAFYALVEATYTED